MQIRTAMRTKILLFLGTALIVALAAPSVFADTIHNLVLTEQSDTVLTATYDGQPITVVLLSPNQWSVFPPTTVSGIHLNPAGVRVIEPESANTVNIISWSGPFPIHVVSDFPTAELFPSEQYPNGTTFTDAGFDASNGGLVDLTFTDLADAAETAPEPGSLSLLCTGLLGLALLVGLKRYRNSPPTVA
jgi:hypothetical protein